ncbi:hypothetical protein [Paucisalibacillus globulus]|uniref:hypothetical protein n=1 Tax=Paucisalibacillus globulus TaxID=351095 RepID=UPI00041566FA|nr:hypothetical protein [Paucisalibacillus globulus]
MAVIVSLVPLLIIIIIILWFVTLKKRLTRKSLTLRQSTLIFIVYVTILLITTVVSLFLPSSEANIIEDPHQSEEWNGGLYMKAMQGEFSSIATSKISRSWEIPYTGDVITLASDYYDEGILVEKTDELNGQIEVYYIKDWQTLGVNSVSMDVSEYTPDMDVEMTSNTLQFVSPEKESTIHLAFNDLAFPMKQLIGESQFGNGFGSSGSSFFYIRVPRNLNVEFSDYMYIDYVEN